MKSVAREHRRGLATMLMQGGVKVACPVDETRFQGPTLRSAGSKESACTSSPLCIAVLVS